MKIKQILLCVLSAMLLFGCANKGDFQDYAQSIDSSNQAGQSAITAYFNKKSVDNQNLIKALTSNPQQAQNNQMAIVLYTILSQQNDEKVMRHFIPHYAAKPTTNGDIGLAFTNNFLPTAVKWGAGAWLGGKVVDGLSATTTTLGAGATMVNQSSGGDINSGTTVNLDSFNPSDSYNPVPLETP